MQENDKMATITSKTQDNFVPFALFNSEFNTFQKNKSRFWRCENHHDLVGLNSIKVLLNGCFV